MIVRGGLAQWYLLVSLIGLPRIVNAIPLDSSNQYASEPQTSATVLLDRSDDIVDDDVVSSHVKGRSNDAPHRRQLQSENGGSIESRYKAYCLNGTDVTNVDYYYVEGLGPNVLVYTLLELNDPTRLMYSNLGGMGPDLSSPAHVAMRGVADVVAHPRPVID